MYPRYYMDGDVLITSSTRQRKLPGEKELKLSFQSVSIYPLNRDLAVESFKILISYRTLIWISCRGNVSTASERRITHQRTVCTCYNNYTYE